MASDAGRLLIRILWVPHERLIWLSPETAMASTSPRKAGRYGKASVGVASSSASRTVGLAVQNRGDRHDATAEARQDKGVSALASKPEDTCSTGKAKGGA
jgi:hypothetical protein